MVSHFATIHANSSSEPIKIASKSIEVLKEYDWPGNIRELSNLVDRFSALHPGAEVDLRDMMPSMVPPALRSVALDNKLDTLAIDDSNSSDYLPSVNDGEDDPQVPPKSGQEVGPTNEVEEAIMLAQGWKSFPEEGIELKKTIQDIEKKYIELLKVNI